MKSLTTRETLYYLARLSYKSGLITDADISRLTKSKASAKNSRSYYRALDILNERKSNTKSGLYDVP